MTLHFLLSILINEFAYVNSNSAITTYATSPDSISSLKASMALPVGKLPTTDREENIFLGWPLTISCNISNANNVTWMRYDSVANNYSSISAGDNSSYYSIVDNKLLAPAVREKYENNTIFQCKSSGDATTLTVKIVVLNCDTKSPCKKGTCIFVNEHSSIPFVTCDCDEEYEGELCDKEYSNTSSLVLMAFGTLATICLIFIIALVLRKRKTDDIVRKVVGQSSKSSGVAAKRSQKTTKAV